MWWKEFGLLAAIVLVFGVVIMYIELEEQKDIEFVQNTTEKREISLPAVVKKLQRIAQFGEDIQLQRAAVGYNTNLDLVCDGVKLMENLFDDQNPLEPWTAAGSVGTLQEFGSSFGFFFRQGSAAERAATNSDVCIENRYFGI